MPSNQVPRTAFPAGLPASLGKAQIQLDDAQIQLDYAQVTPIKAYFDELRSREPRIRFIREPERIARPNS